MESLDEPEGEGGHRGCDVAGPSHSDPRRANQLLGSWGIACFLYFAVLIRTLYRTLYRPICEFKSLPTIMDINFQVCMLKLLVGSSALYAAQNAYDVQTKENERSPGALMYAPCTV